MTLRRRDFLRFSAFGGVITLANAACGPQAPQVAAPPPAPAAAPPAAAKPTVAPAVISTSAAKPGPTPASTGATPTATAQPLSPANGAPKRGGVIRAPGSQLVHLD